MVRRANKKQRGSGQKGWSTLRKLAGAGREGRKPAHALSLPTLIVVTERNENRLFAQGLVEDKPCSVTIDTGAAVTVVRPNITAGLPER
jgi:hypothetical protein